MEDNNQPQGQVHQTTDEAGYTNNEIEFADGEGTKLNRAEGDPKEKDKNDSENENNPSEKNNPSRKSDSEAGSSSDARDNDDEDFENPDDDPA